MPQFAVLIYTDDSAHALDATEEELAEPNGHGDELAASGTMTAAWAFTLAISRARSALAASPTARSSMPLRSLPGCTS